MNKLFQYQLRAFCLVAVLGLIGCTAQHTASLAGQTVERLELVNTVEVTRQQQWRLPPQTGLFVAMAENELIPNIELGITQALYIGLKEQFPLSITSAIPMSPHAAMAKARLMGKPVTVYHQVSLLDEKLSSWNEVDADMDSGVRWGRDRLRVQIQLYDSYSGALMDDAFVQSVGKRLALSSITIDDLVALAARQYAKSISSFGGR